MYLFNFVFNNLLFLFCVIFPPFQYKFSVLFILIKSNIRETWRVILVSEADIFLSESLRILAERLSQSEIGLPLRQICYYSPPEEVGVFSTEINLLNYIMNFLNIQFYAFQ